MVKYDSGNIIVSSLYNQAFCGSVVVDSLFMFFCVWSVFVVRYSVSFLG